MAGELQLAHGVSGRTLYAVVRNTAGQVWNGTSFEAYNASNWATYDIALTEQSTSGYYVGNFPAVAAGVYPVEVRHQSGGGPAVGDTVVGDGAIDWTGSAVAGVKDGVDANVVEWLGTGVIVSQDAVPVVSVGWFADPNDSYAGQVLSYSAGNGVPDVNVKRWNFQTVQNIGVEVLRGIANRYGDIQGATSTTVTLDNGARPTDGFYVGMIVDFNGSTLFSGQPRVITGYVGATRVATVDSAWVSTPTAGTGFYLFENSTYADVVKWGGQAAQVSETDLPLVTLRNFVDHDDGVATRGFIAPGDVDLLTIESGAITVNDRLDVFLSSRASQTSVNALPTASANAAAVLAAGDVDGYSLEQTLKLCLAALAGKLSGAATSTITIRAADDSKNRITASVDQNGNRLLVTLDPAG